MPSLKVTVLLTLALCLALPAGAQTPGVAYSGEQLDQLLGPIALYPDALVAVILPASTVPSDITLAADYLAANGTAGGIAAQPWDASVKALAHYPEVVKWMNANLDWTQALGAAFAQQPADVMQSVQQLRAQARTAGTLVDTPQQSVATEGDNIRIIPAQPDTIYVPEYDPAVVYETASDYYGPAITFGVGFQVGAWLGFECDWDDFGIWEGPWSPGWGYRRDWRQAGSNRNSWHAWRPDPRRSRSAVRNFYRPENQLPRAGLIAGHLPLARPRVAPPHPAVSRAYSVPDYRGRGIGAPRPSRPAPSVQIFGGYNRGTQTREFSHRGQSSRSAPVRSMPAPRAAAPARGAGESPSNHRDRR